MNIKIVGIKNRGNLKKERIIIKALSNLDLGYYIVFLTKMTGEKSFSSEPKKVFWFPDKEINKDDLIVLYSKKGKKSIKENESGNTTHFFYWNLENPVFEDDKSHAVVIEANGWA